MPKWGKQKEKGVRRGGRKDSERSEKREGGNERQKKIARVESRRKQTRTEVSKERK